MVLIFASSRVFAFYASSDHLHRVCYDITISPFIQNFVVLFFVASNLSAKNVKFLHHAKIYRYTVYSSIRKRKRHFNPDYKIAGSFKWYMD